MDETWWTKADQLDKDQSKVIDLPPDGSYLLCGPPGSGKTNLLLLRAAFLHRSGKKNILIITFNRMLKEFLSTGANNYPFSPEKIQTFRSWGGHTLTDNGIKFQATGKYSVVHESIVDGLTAMKDHVCNEIMYECILLDESQDYTIKDIAALRRFSKDIFAVGDNKQRIYEADGALEYLEEFCSPLPKLEYHYRNGTKICRLADGILGNDDTLLDTSNYNEQKYPSTVKIFGNISIAEQVNLAVQDLETQLEAYPDEWIGILVPQKVHLASVWEALQKSSLAERVQLQRYDAGYDKLDASRPIVVTTCHSAKGLEFRAVHLMAMDGIKKMRNGQRLAFTAVTRAKTSLHIFHNASLPGYMERGIAAIEGAPKATPKIEDLFGGGF